MTTKRIIHRRSFLNFASSGIGATALLSLLQRENRLSAAQEGGESLSHLDSFDYKPELEKQHGKSLNASERPDIFFGKVGLLRQSDWKFHQRGESGLWVSEMFPHLAQQADELTVIRSMVADSANHTPALFFENSGFGFNGFPALGSWLSYGLGNELDSLPTYVVLPDRRGGPNGGASNWTSGFLPAQHQGVVLQGGDQPVRDLFPQRPVAKDSDEDVREFLAAINHKHLDRVGDDELLRARIRSYELAARMQSSIPEVADLNAETREVHSLYGTDDKTTADCAQRCLLARRLLERGVRFVQICSGGPIAGNPRASWDAHENVHQNHTAEASRIDQPVAALLTDLRRRGMLDDTLVLFTTEFGRTPFTQSAENTVGPGRDHNRYGFSVWMAGAGLKPGMTYGSTDEIGWKATENPATWHDFHATILHLFGIDHTRLTHYHNGIQRRLTNVHGHVIKDVLA